MTGAWARNRCVVGECSVVRICSVAASAEDKNLEKVTISDHGACASDTLNAQVCQESRTRTSVTMKAPTGDLKALALILA